MNRGLFIIVLSLLCSFAFGQVSVGDILCASNKTVSPSEYADHLAKSPNDVAIGVVFFVSEDSLHGLAVHLRQQASGIPWSTLSADLPLPNFQSITNALTDTAGYSNTKMIREAKRSTAETYPVAYCIEFSDDWFVPAVKQLKLLTAQKTIVNESLNLLKNAGIKAEELAKGYYWSSTECSIYYAWYVHYNGNVHYFDKDKTDASLKVRSIRFF